MPNARIIMSLVKFLCLSLYSLALLLGCFAHAEYHESQSPFFDATIQIVILVHPYNKLLYLPYLLGALESQHYPKDRLRLHLITERIFYEESYYDLSSPAFDPHSRDERFEILDDRIHANDQTLEQLKLWTSHNRHLYNELELTISNVRLSEKLFGEPNSRPTTTAANKNDGSNSYWNKDRFKFVIDTKNQELYEAYQSWADFVLFLDSDVILTEPYTLANLTSLYRHSPDLVVVAPLLYSTGTYSNFWAGMNAKGYYVRTDRYMPILERKDASGTFDVPMVHTCFMIDARKRKSRALTFDPNKVQSSLKHPLPYDDIIAFAKSAEQAGIALYIDNRYMYGYIPPPISQDPKASSDYELKQTLLDLELESLVEGPPFPVAPSLESYIEPLLEKPDTLGVGQIYVINLRRRPERRQRMKASLDLLQIRANFWDATDGKRLTQEYLDKHQIRSLEGYVDPYHKRPMTFGEIGCFLSHYRIWEHAWRNNFSNIIILEDDVRFEKNFRRKWAHSLELFEKLEPTYDFLYLGRKLNGNHESEEKLKGGHFVRPGYSYWTIGYMITREGIRKLLHANPLGRMIPVDEFLPLMYGSHSNRSLVQGYARIEPLKAASLRHLVVSPTHYVGDDAYISDTEDSDEVTHKNTAQELEEEHGPEPNEPQPENGSSTISNQSGSAVAEPQPPPITTAGSYSSASSLDRVEL